MSAFTFGVGLSLLASVFKAGKGITTKLAVGRTDEYATTWAYRFVAAIIFAIALFITQGFEIPRNPMFWMALGISSIGYTISSILLTKAYKVSDISLIAPLIAFVPIATSVPAWVILNETPTPVAAIGIVLVSIGAYTLQIHKKDKGLMEPIRAIVRDRGAQYIALFLLVVAVLPSVDKIGLQYAPPLLWVFSTTAVVSLLLSVLLLGRGASPGTAAMQEEWKVLVLLGFLNAGLNLVQAHAYTVMDVAYVQAIKRASILLVIVAGWIIFEEEHIRQRFLGGSIILIGIILIILFG